VPYKDIRSLTLKRAPLFSLSLCECGCIKQSVIETRPRAVVVAVVNQDKAGPSASNFQVNSNPNILVPWLSVPAPTLRNTQLTHFCLPLSKRLSG
jgi:hypothetical protein